VSIIILVKLAGNLLTKCTDSALAYSDLLEVVSKLLFGVISWSLILKIVANTLGMTSSRAILL
jgi:hypothetical protein